MPLLVTNVEEFRKWVSSITTYCIGICIFSFVISAALPHDRMIKLYLIAFIFFLCILAKVFLWRTSEKSMFAIKSIEAIFYVALCTFFGFALYSTWSDDSTVPTLGSFTNYAVLLAVSWIARRNLSVAKRSVSESRIEHSTLRESNNL